MKNYKAIAMIAIIITGVSLLAVKAESKTVTQGTLELEKIASSISSDLQDYSQKRDILVANIKSTQEEIKTLQQNSSKTDNKKTIISIKAKTLKETSRLLNYYSSFYKLNMEKVELILPKIDKLKLKAEQSSSARSVRMLKQPEFRKNMKNLYGNISAIAMKFGKGRTKKEISSLLKENELLYQVGQNGRYAYDNIITTIDKLSGSLRSIYAKTTLRANILENKKARTQMAIELMRYALALRPIQQTMLELNPEGIINIPEVDYTEFVDPILNTAEFKSGEDEMSIYSDSDVDSTLKDYQNGPNFLQ